MKKCKYCGKNIIGRVGQAAYCSDKCKRDYRHKAYLDQRGYQAPLATATKGAINEYVVVIDLLKRGYLVFRACSPACKCDLVVFKNGKSLRVEVTTGVLGKKLYYTPHNKINFDLMAVVTGCSCITYFPEVV